jgi:ribosomal protein S6--L-glutamate ligase
VSAGHPRPRFVALVSGFGWHVRDLRRAAEEVDVTFEAVSFPRIVGRVGLAGATVEAAGIDLTAADGVLVRMMPPGSLEQVVFRMDALHRLAALGVPVLNPPRAVEAAVDKYLALARIEAAGLPVPATWSGESADEALAAFEALGGDVVVKPLFGSEGRGLVRVSDFELARRTFRTLERLGAVLYLQRAVRHPGHDLRAFVLGGRLVGAIRRHASGGDWRTNVAVGGRAEACTLDPAAERLALQAARAVGAEMAGVDLLPDLDRGSLAVIEVNAVPGWKALAAATGLDVAGAILTHLKEARR